MHVDVRSMLAALAEGDLLAARTVYTKSIPFPGILSRVCDEPCRATCTRAQVGEALALERMIPGGHPAVGLEYRIDKARAAKARLAWLAPVAGDAGIIRPVFAPGDLLVFDDLLLHRTGYSEGMTENRYATETWMFATSSYPERQVPILV